MGKLKSGVFGGISGKVGSVVGSSCNGVDYVRSQPLIFRDAKSESQIKSREKFCKIGELAKSILPTVIRPVWNNRVEYLSGYNLFMKKNFENVDPELSLADCDKLIISFGDLLLPDDISVQRNEDDPGRITIRWTDNSGLYGVSSDDILRVVVIRGDKGVSLRPTGKVRSDETAEIDLPFEGDQKVRVFVFFEDRINNEYSDDVSFLV